MTEKTNHDVIIIGAGSAGLSAALVLARAQAKVLVLDSGKPRNAPAAHMHGYLSRDGMPPSEFLAAGRQEAAQYGAAIEGATVASVEPGQDGRFDVILSGGERRSGRALLVATGLRDELPAIPGVREYWGSLVHHCPYCHGHEVRDQAIAVIGGPARELSLKQVGLLLRYSQRVTFVTNGIQLSQPERHRLEAFGASVIEGDVSRLSRADGGLDVVTLADGSTTVCEAVFVAPLPLPNDAILRSLACASAPDSGLVLVDAAGQTSVPGVWAAGNVVNPNAQVITAAGAGSASAMAINGWLLQHDMDLAAAQATPPNSTH